MRARLLGVLALATVLPACGDGDGDLRVIGDTSYVRCMSRQAPSARSWQAGSLRITRGEARRIRIEGAPESWRLAAFGGPADPPAVRALRRRRPHLALMLGGIGEDVSEASRTLAALAELGVPVLVVAGGADRHATLDRAFEGLQGAARDRVVDASAMRSITVRSVRGGAIELVPLAGAPEGRYAITNDACGFSAGDVDAVAEALDAPSAGVRRYVVSWAAPRHSGSASLGVASVEAGSPLVSTLIERTQAEGALFAWPFEAAGRAEREPLRVAVRPLAGPWITGGDGARTAPGATLLTAGAGGLEVAHDSP